MPSKIYSLFLSRRTFLLGVLGTFFILGIFLFASTVIEQRSTVSSLRLVSIVFRHGDRTPTSFYPTDPYRNSDLWSDGLGALTKVGKRQMYQLGRFFRSRYGEFINEIYSPNDVYVFSSDHDRCLMSAQLCLAGLYPPVREQIWHKGIPWQPIPVHTVPRNLDKLIVVKKPCPKYKQELNKTYSHEFFINLNAENAELYRYLTKHSGMIVSNVMEVEHLFNILEVEKLLNLKLPEWAEKYYNKMKELAMIGLSSLTFTTTTKRLKAGPLLAEVVRHMTERRLNLTKKDRSLHLYSGHDVNIVSLLRTLGFEEMQKPEYGASIIFELYQPPSNESDHLVELWYLNNTEQDNPIRLTLPGCHETCKLENFLRITNPVLPIDWEAECLLE